MCVIIFIPQGEQISKDELKAAWNTNSDGAGYAARVNNKVQYERGFMSFNQYFNAIKHLIGVYDLVLHFRISTSSKINKVQTHPYEVGSKKTLKGVTCSPVVCMNGVIHQQEEYKGFNDTMSYIQDHAQTFNIVAEHLSSDILNLIEEDTGSRWAMVTPEKVLISKGFQKEAGKYYSNKNHLQRSYYYGCYSRPKNYRKTPSLKSLVSKTIYNELKRDKYLYFLLLDIIDIWKDVPYVMEHIFNSPTIEELEQTALMYY